MKNLNDLSLAARILSADLARGCDWSNPSTRPHCKPNRGVRGLVVGTTLVLMSLLSSVAHAGGLADAVAAGLGKSAVGVSAVAKSAPKAKPVAAKRAPVCGAWTELHQGSGRGRTCEAGAL
jgi:hypothetical protein